MNILIVGQTARVGSFQMRGIQVGAVLGARVTTQPTDADFGWADVTILIKRAIQAFGRQAARAQTPIIWDALDFWQQPAQNALDANDGIGLAMLQRAGVDVAVTIGATQAMADALGGVYIPHHCRLGLTPTPPRPQVRTVGYDGAHWYLGAWERALREACARRGWSFVINPPDLSTADILVALRDDPWNGPLSQDWKSGVKIGNAICAGRPILAQKCAAARELHPIGSWIQDLHDLEVGCDICADPVVQLRAYEDGLARADQFTVEAIVETYYRPLLARVMSQPSCLVMDF